MTTALDHLLAELTAAGAHALTATNPHAARCRLSRENLAAVTDRIAELGLEVQLLCATDTRHRSGDFTLTYVFTPPRGRPQLTALVAVPAGEPRFPSLALRSFAASRFEREIHDLLGLVPVGHPDLRRLAVHQFWPDGYFPQRRDVAIRRDFADAGQPFPFRRVEGAGLFEITVGPVHAGIIEPGHFRFTVEGETIVNLETRLGFVHKGTEKLFETLPFERTPALAECVSGDETVAHALAYCQALEGLAGADIPRRAASLRVILLELERLYNHVGDVGMIVNDTGFAFGHAHCFRLREEMLRLNARLTGHRLMRGATVPGGVADTVNQSALDELPGAIDRLVAEFLDIAELASGIDADLRRDAPFAAYDKVDVAVPTYETGDVWARTMVRIREAREAASLIARTMDGIPAGPARVELPPLREGDQTSAVESWRGPVWYWVMAGGPEQVERVKIADPSFRNWPALEYAVLNNIVPDFPLCNKSFNLSYSGSDL